MKFGKIVHYFASLLVGIGSFFLSYGLLQYFVTRNISGNSAISELGKLIFNFAIAGFVSGTGYAATFKHGYLPLAIIPSISIGGPLLALAVANGQIGGIESLTFSAWEFAVTVVLAAFCGYIGARFVRILTPTSS